MELLVAVDRSEESRNALEYALDLAAAFEANLTVVHSVDPAVYDRGGSAPVADVPDADERLVLENVADAEERGERLLEEAAEEAADRGVEAGTELLYGDPVETISGYADEGAVDGIVVGHRGHSGRARELLGSVARGLVEEATVPVTVVR
ncbi:universal stress protein [Salinilacihabitans rarus]|uniref:universal stress protein n=1 Tax=Salinilacihabitans rarus TaxID=2961596 RepID=UPI0020C8A909|nr:universal stress protein [Salinilacihabitans rarus]